MATSARNRNQAGSERAAVVLQRIGKVFGNPPKGTRIASLYRGKQQLDEFDWLLLIMSLEIDLKVRVPPRLLNPKNLTVAQFAQKVAGLPCVDSDDHTLQTLQFLAGALLGETESTPARGTESKRKR